jgi:flavin reductase (DIM6/NTAB) family NADH-FMN oxidoreductase RutF
MRTRTTPRITVQLASWAVPQAAFQSLVGRLDVPMFIVTAAGAGERAGCLIGFATQTSIDPPRFLACISDKNRTCRVARDASTLAVHLVPADRGDIAELFGGETGDDTDKFARAAWHDGPDGVPLLDDCPSRFAGRILERSRMGDHIGHLLEPFDGSDAGDDWLSFTRAKEIDPGHEA